MNFVFLNIHVNEGQRITFVRRLMKYENYPLAFLIRYSTNTEATSRTRQIFPRGMKYGNDVHYNTFSENKTE